MLMIDLAGHNTTLYAPIARTRFVPAWYETL